MPDVPRDIASTFRPAAPAGSKRSLLWRIGLLVLLAMVIVAVSAAFGLRITDLFDRSGDLERLLTWKQDHVLWSALIFFTAYVLVAACSLPMATPMTFAAGYLFGFWAGLLIVSFASTIGATLAFLAARWLARDAVQVRFADRLSSINEGLNKDGAFYLFTLRIVPIVPFFIVNLAMGLTPIRARTFYWVSQLAMLPMTAVYANAGTQLAAIDDPGMILSPGVVTALVLIGLFPWAARAVSNWYRERRLYARWRRPRRFDRNLIVIGAGAAGLVGTLIAASARAKVTLVESGKMGGDCLNYGCVPSKALIRSARSANELRNGERYGLHGVAGSVAFPAVMRRIGEVIARIAPNDSAERYRALGAEVLQGRATIRTPWTVDIVLADGSHRSLTSRSILIATGAEPIVPPLPGIEQSGYVTSDTLWEEFARHEHAPRRLLVLGGGAIGCELAQAFARLGSRVTVIEVASRLLGREDPEIGERVRVALEADGVQVLVGCRVSAVECSGDGKTALVDRGGRPERIEFDELLCALGRKPRLGGLGLEALGVAVEPRLEIDARLRTTYPNIYVAGDVTGRHQFTHVAGHQAWCATANALFRPFYRPKADDRLVPRVTFIEPEIASVGLTEVEAQRTGVPYDTTRLALSELDRAVIDGAEDGFVKVLTIPGRDRILGVAIVAPHAGELLAEFTLAMKNGLGLRRILGTIHAYPTWSEAGQRVAAVWRRERIPRWATRVLERFHRLRRGGDD